MIRYPLYLSCIFSFIFCAMPLYSFQQENDTKYYHYYCTVADKAHFELLMNLIGSIHKADFDHLDEIAVFDIGLTTNQVALLSTIEKTKVYSVEMTHPDLCKYFVTNPWGREVRGWFAWKPVIIKQALDMFPSILYIDSGSLILTSPDNLFKHIHQNGYFLIDVGHNISDRVTQPVLEKVISKFSKEDQSFILAQDTYSIDGGTQGLSRQLSESYILPMYELSKDLTLFADDGSAKMGFGEARHDQTLFTVYARKLRLNVGKQGWNDLKVDGRTIPFHVHWHPSEVTNQTCIFRCRGNKSFSGNMQGSIRIKSEP